MIVYDINSKMQFGICMEFAPQRLILSAYAFKEGASSTKEVESTFNTEFMSTIEILHSLAVELPEMKALPEWEDHTLWNIVIKDMHGPEFSQPINRNSFTMASKINRAGFINIFSSIVLEMIVQHRGVSSFDEIGISVTTGKGFPFVCNVPCEEKDRSLAENSGMGQELRRRLLPTMHITGPDSIAPGGAAEYLVQVFAGGEPFNKPVTVLLESTGGYLPLRRLDGIIHSATFKLHAEALEHGQAIHLKAGFKYWSNLTRKEIRIQ